MNKLLSLKNNANVDNISWKLTTNLDKQENFFLEKIDRGYIMETYICSCGSTNFIIKHPNQKLNYTCKECENSFFYNANTAWNYTMHFLLRHPELKLRFEYVVKSSIGTISAQYVTNIPKNIDFSKNEIIYEQKVISALALIKNTQLDEYYLSKFEHHKNISLQLHKTLIDYINNHSSLSHLCTKEKRLNMEMAIFFFKNNHLKDIDFYYWHDISKFKGKEVSINEALSIISNYSKVKSVKKALYQNYIFQLESFGEFDSTFIEAFFENIDDINILSKLLILQFDYRFEHMYDYKEELNELIVFFKKHYSQIQLLKLFSSYSIVENNYLLIDTIIYFINMKDILERKFKKVSCNVATIRNEFHRCSLELKYKEVKDKKLLYTQEDIKPCIAIDSYRVKVPENGKELYSWANYLDNCMAQYYDSIIDKETIIYCFFKDNALAFAVQICNNHIEQYAGKRNSDLNVEEAAILFEWFDTFFINKIKTNIATADVVIYDPKFCYAVAIRYDSKKDKAPYVVAKGAKHFASRIKKIAKGNCVPIVINKPLARRLYDNIGVNTMIEEYYFLAVAEILAHVYKKNRRINR